MTDLDVMKQAVVTIDRAARAADAALKADLDAKAAAKKERSPFDRLEEKVMASGALAAAASGNPEQVKAALASARGKAMQAAADGADTSALEAMVRDLERLAKIAEENRDRKKNGSTDESAAAIPAIVAVAKS